MPVTIDDWQIYTIVFGTSSIRIVLREQHQSIALKTGRSITCYLYWQMGPQHGITLTGGSTHVTEPRHSQQHHAVRLNSSRPMSVHQTRTGTPTPRNTLELIAFVCTGCIDGCRKESWAFNTDSDTENTPTAGWQENTPCPTVYCLLLRCAWFLYTWLYEKPHSRARYPSLQ